MRLVKTIQFQFGLYGIIYCGQILLHEVRLFTENANRNSIKKPLKINLFKGLEIKQIEAIFATLKSVPFFI